MPGARHDIRVGATGSIAVIVDTEIGPVIAGRHTSPGLVGDIEINPIIGIVRRKGHDVGIGQRLAGVVGVGCFGGAGQRLQEIGRASWRERV